MAYGFESFGQRLAGGANPVGAGPHRQSVGVGRLLVSTAELPAREQFAFWRAELLDAAFGVHGEPLTATDRGFRGEVEAWVAPCLSYYRYWP